MTYLHADPVPAQCPDCNRGYTWTREWLFVIATRIRLLVDDLEDQKRNRPLHPWLAQDAYPAAHRSLLPTTNPLLGNSAPVRPSLDIIPLVEGLAGEQYDATAAFGCGFDTEDITRAIIRAAGLDPKKWGVCPTCGGSAWVQRNPDDEDDDAP